MMEKVINILLVEDDTVDVRDTQRTLDKMGLLYKLNIARNGEEALDFLEQADRGINTCPDIILLDLNMPKMNGIEFLETIRKADRWKQLKVFVITTSEEKEDRDLAKKLGISGYIVKPLKLQTPSTIDSFNLMIDLMNVKRN